MQSVLSEVGPNLSKLSSQGRHQYCIQSNHVRCFRKCVGKTQLWSEL